VAHSPGQKLLGGTHVEDALDLRAIACALEDVPGAGATRARRVAETVVQGNPVELHAIHWVQAGGAVDADAGPGDGSGARNGDLDLSTPDVQQTMERGG
jgi:hypothetical protein